MIRYCIPPDLAVPPIVIVAKSLNVSSLYQQVYRRVDFGLSMKVTAWNSVSDQFSKLDLPPVNQNFVAASLQVLDKKCVKGRMRIGHSHRSFTLLRAFT